MNNSPEAQLTPEELAKVDQMAMDMLLADLLSQVSDSSKDAVESIYADYYLNEVDKQTSSLNDEQGFSRHESSFTRSR